MAVRFLYSKLTRSSKFSSNSFVPFVPYGAIGFVVAVSEAGMINLGSALCSKGYGEVVHGGTSDSDAILAVGLLSSILYVSAAYSLGFYRVSNLIAPGRYLGRMAAVFMFVLLGLTAVLFALRTSGAVSRSGILGFAALMLALSWMTRLVASGCIDALMRHKLIVGRPVVLVGDPDELDAMSPDYLLQQLGLRDVGRITVDGVSSPHSKCNYQLEDAINLARRSMAKEFIVTVKGDRADALHNISEGLRKSPLRVRMLPNKAFRALLSRDMVDGELGIHLVDLQRSPMNMPELYAKRALDIVVSSFAIIVLMPVFVAVAVAIKMDSVGPVIFRQRRNGFDEKVFYIYKFRSMSVQEEKYNVVQARKNDPRVTRVGRFLRRTSIDELPQLLNVLKGEMSIVGPRPHALAHDDEYKVLIGDYYKRHHVKPGITGWAQVKGFRGETALPRDMQDRINCDVWYIRNWSFTLDLSIIFKTCLEVVKHDAY